MDCGLSRIQGGVNGTGPVSTLLRPFTSYGAGERGDLAFIKGELFARTGKLLRPDAALLLLSLYDQMILRPYTGSIQLQGPEGTLPLGFPAIARDEDNSASA